MKQILILEPLGYQELDIPHMVYEKGYVEYLVIDSESPMNGHLFMDDLHERAEDRWGDDMYDQPMSDWVELAVEILTSRGIEAVHIPFDNVALATGLR